MITVFLSLGRVVSGGGVMGGRARHIGGVTVEKEREIKWLFLLLST